MNNISTNLLVPEAAKGNENSENSITIFQIVIPEQGLSTETYVKILINLNELIESLSIINEETLKSEIVLLDSGSDTNLGVETGVKTAGSLFQIFKEVWDYFTNRKYYLNKQNNDALIDNITVLTKIKEAVDSGGFRR